MPLSNEEGSALGAYRKAALLAARGKLSYSELAVYRAYVDCIHWPDKTAYKGEKKIAEEAGITERTVRYARKKLRLKGAIEPIAYEKGGRGKSTIYKFPWVEKGGNNDRVSDENNTKRGKYSARKGGNNQPPYNSSSNYKKASASRGQVDKAPVEGTADEWKVRRLHELCERMGYGEAKAQLEREIAENEGEGRQA